MALPAFSLAMAQPRFLISRDLGTFNRTEASRRACGPGIVPETSRLSVAIRCRSPIVTAGQWRFPLLETPAELSSLQARLRLRAATMRLAFKRSEEHTSELQSLMRISYAVFCLKKKKSQKNKAITHTT